MRGFLLSLFISISGLGELIGDWSSVASYSGYDEAMVLEKGKGKIGFASSNFCIFGSRQDTTSYDTRTLDILGRLGIGNGMDIGFKYTSPRAGVLSIKYNFLRRPLLSSFSLGFGYMKATLMTEPENLTYYLFDIYPSLKFQKPLSSSISILASLNGIVSYYMEEDRYDRFFNHYLGINSGLALGNKRFCFIPEANLYKGRVYHYDYIKGKEKEIPSIIVSFGIGFFFYP